MRRVISAFVVLVSVSLIFSPLRLLSQDSGEGSVDGEQQSTSKRSELVDVKANVVYPYKINDTTSVLCLVGEFAAQHNGAVITADSAVRYENERIECFGNVLINKNTTYAYCDRVLYNSDTNEALLFAPLVKVVDEDVTMYTYNFKFNTKSNIGEYWGMGVTVRQTEEVDQSGENNIVEEVMESKRGFYLADTKWVIGVDEVELSGDKYLMQSDSAVYDMQLDRAYFATNTNIWNEGGEYLYGDKGDYDKLTQLFRVERNGYLLTEEQEGWSDSMDYFRASREAVMRGNIQLDDTTNKSSAFADFAHYWGENDKVLLTRNPVVLNYDSDQQGGAQEESQEENQTEQPQDSLRVAEPLPVDTLFLKGDTIILITMHYEFEDKPEAKPEKSTEASDKASGDGEDEDGDKEGDDGDGESTSVDSDAEGVPDSLSTQNGDKKAKKKVKKIKEPKGPSKRDIKQQQKSELREERSRIKLHADQVREHRRLSARAVKVQQRIDTRTLKGRSIYSDSLLLLDLKSSIARLRDSIDGVYDGQSTAMLADSIAQGDSLLMSGEEGVDSTYRLVRAYRSVRAYKSDLQFVCDSLSGNTADSIMQLYFDPVVWSDANQIVSEHMDLYIYNGELDFAHFIGNPIMSSEVIVGDTIHYNQIKGKEMFAYFENNQVVRNDVDGNVQTIYYMQDEKSGEPTTYAYVESGTATFLIEDRVLDGIIYRAKPVYTFAPLDKIPATKSMYLNDFAWHDTLRPTRQSIFDRTIRPSQRERIDSMDLPLFPIRAKITRERERLVRSGKWKDRSEHVSEAATLWMRSLGFVPGEPRKEDESIF